MIQDFYNINRHKSWEIMPIPEKLTDPIEITEWIFKQPIGWIELDLDLPLDIWLEESNKALPYLVEHREGGGHLGWTSCCIHGLSVEKTGTDMTAPISEYHWTSLSELTPTIKQFWKQFPFENLLRVRFMNLAASGYVSPHNDSPVVVDNMLDQILPINIAITHPDQCYMTLKDKGVVPWVPGKLIMVNICNDHSVINYSDTPRLHMIGHGYAGSKKREFCELIVRSYEKQLRQKTNNHKSSIQR